MSSHEEKHEHGYVGGSDPTPTPTPPPPPPDPGDPGDDPNANVKRNA